MIVKGAVDMKPEGKEKNGRLFSAAILKKGMRDGIPIGLGYLAVAFSLGIVAKSAGVNAVQGFVASLLTYASAGELAGFNQIAAGALPLEIAALAVIINARYLLMSCALSQRLAPEAGIGHRLLMGAAITDEIFGITIAQDGWLNPYYSLGAWLIAVPLWSVGTSLGILMGEVLPARIVSALSVALFGMFLAVIIPPCKKSRAILITVACSFLCSIGIEYVPILKNLSSGTKVILLTLVLCSAATLLAPVKEEEA